MNAHIIRLRGPWDYEPLARVTVSVAGVRQESREELPPAGRAQLPADWGATLGSDFRGRVRYRRHFGLPTNLEPHEHVWLVIDGVTGSAEIRLNGLELGHIESSHASERDVTEILQPRNQLEIDVTSDGSDGGVTGEIRLEIRLPQDSA